MFIISALKPYEAMTHRVAGVRINTCIGFLGAVYQACLFLSLSTVHLLSLISSSTQLCNLCSGILTQWHASPLSSLCIFPTLTCRKRA